jgi:hypothetical protein
MQFRISSLLGLAKQGNPSPLPVEFEKLKEQLGYAGVPA